ncbi:MAG: preprotein translocase subunit YajC [Bilophila wadsworthia]
MFASVAHAMGTAGAGQAGGADALMQFVPLIAMLAIFYFLLIRPQQKRAKQHKAMLEALKKGDQVLTTGGLVGRVVDIDGDILSIDLGSTTVSLGRAYVVSVMDPRSKAVKEEVGSFCFAGRHAFRRSRRAYVCSFFILCAERSAPYGLIGKTGAVRITTVQIRPGAGGWAESDALRGTP